MKAAFEKLFKLHKLFKSARYPVSLERIRETLRCSRATAHRMIAEFRDGLGAPIETTIDPPGYRYTDAAYEIPSLWFTDVQIQALLLVQQLLKGFQPGLLDDALEPLRVWLEKILASQGLNVGNSGRIRLLKHAARKPGAFFKTVATSVLQRTRVRIRYDARSTGDTTEREISPQRLIHYRDNWYLDAWCHSREALRTFSVDRIEQAEALKTAPIEIDDAELDQALGKSYGMFSGPPVAIAMLRFTPKRAAWVGPEQWHPDQKSWYEPSGHYVLEVPYSLPDELILDVLRYGPEVEVLAPLELRQAVAERHRAAAAQYA